jgi:hypothetical protein
MTKNTAETEYISIYTRQQAIEDGVLIDVTETATEAGFRYPVAVTASVWADIVPEKQAAQYGQDLAGRLWDVVYMCRLAAKATSGPQLAFKVILRDGPGPVSKYTRKYKAICGPGDNSEPVITIMKPDED